MEFGGVVGFYDESFVVCFRGLGNIGGVVGFNDESFVVCFVVRIIWRCCDLLFCNLSVCFFDSEKFVGLINIFSVAPGEWSTFRVMN